MHPDPVQNQVLRVQVPGSSSFLKEAMQELLLPSQASLTDMRALETDHPGHQER